MLTQSRLKELLHYDPETGVWTWLVSPANNTPAGDIAGGLDERGYRRIRVDGRKYRASRLSVLYMTGKWPSRHVDHKDTDTKNGRWGNLREATNSQNIANSRVRSDNKSGLKGVHWSKQCEAWRADLGVSGRREYLGLFDCPAAASFAYQIAADIHHGEFARVS